MSTLTDDELETRLRSTYRSVTAATVATPRPLPDRSPRPVTGLRLAGAGAVLALVVALVAVVNVRDTASGRPPVGRHAVVGFVYGYGFAGIRPYDAAIDGLGPATGEVLQYRRSTGTIDVISLRGSPVVPDGFVETRPVHGRVAYASDDGSTLLWQRTDDLAVAVHATGTPPTGELDVAAIADTVQLVSDAAWEQLQQRQGFAQLRVGRDNPSATFPVADGVQVERKLVGTLRSGVQATYTIGRPDGLVITGSGETTSGRSRLDLVTVGDDRMVLLPVGAASDTGSVTFDGAPVEVHTIVDTESGAVMRIGVVRADPRVDHVARFLDEQGRVRFTAHWTGQESA